MTLAETLAWATAQLHDPRVWVALSLASAAMLVASLLALPWIVRRLPADWLVRDLHHGPDGATASHASARPRRPLVVRVARNACGVLLVAAGVTMLVLPGQGLLTILGGLVLLEFPGKRRAIRWCVARPGVLPFIDRLRAAGGQPPLQPPPRGHG